MRIALISDLHANELALDAVLADAERAGYDELVCLGDVATLGPRPSAVLRRLRDSKCRCVLGNHDEFMLDAALVRSYSESPLIVSSVDATREQLSDEDVSFLRSFVRTVSVGDAFLYHGTPRSNMEDLLSSTPNETVDEMLQGAPPAKVFAGGHTHLQMQRVHRGAVIVNPGSLGMPFLEHAHKGPPVILPFAEYAIVTVQSDGFVSADLRRLPLSREALASQVDGWDNPLAAPLRASYTS